jgi:malate dehydrogenase (oxaloacetate-decarboxylating)
MVRPGGDPAFAAVVTVRAGAAEPVEALLGFVEPGWGVRELPVRLPRQRQFVVQTCDEAGLTRLCRMVSGQSWPRVVACRDRLLSFSVGGRIAVRPLMSVDSAEDVALLDLPGSGRLAARVAADPTGVDEVTGRRNRVAVVSDGSAVAGDSGAGSVSVLPMLEGRCALYAHLAGVDAVPLAMATKTQAELVAAVTALAPGFGAVDLVAMSAPTRVQLRHGLAQGLVFDDAQHAMPVAVLAGLRNALAVVGKRLETARLVVCGADLTGSATARLLAAAGASDVVVVGRNRILHPDDGPRLPPHQARLVGWTNLRRLRGDLTDALDAADAVVVLSTEAGVLTRDLVTYMDPAPVVFALAGPPQDDRGERIDDLAAVLATGRVDDPNPVSKVLAFPGLMRGLLNARAPQVTLPMQLAAADVLAGLVDQGRLCAGRLLPDVLDDQVVATVSAAVAAVEAHRRRFGATGVDAARTVIGQEVDP